MTPYKRVLVIVGGTALMATLAIGVVFAETNAAGSTLKSDELAAQRIQLLGDGLVAAVHSQREAIDEFLMSSDPRPLVRYRQAVADEARLADQIGTGVATLSGSKVASVTAALAAVDVANDAWRATVADVAVAAVQSGSHDDVLAAIEVQAADDESSQNATTSFVAQIDGFEAELGQRSDALDQLRGAATIIGVIIELLAAAISLLFVRRYGVTVGQDTRRRVQAATDRIQLVASLRTLRSQTAPEATAALIADALKRLPGVDVAGVYECSADGLRALAVTGLAAFPVQSGDLVPEAHAEYVQTRSRGGPWAEQLANTGEPGSYEARLVELGIKARAVAPIEIMGEQVGVIAVATTDAVHGRRLVEDLPAVAEFASVAEAILAPGLVARRWRIEKRTGIEAMIAAGSFHPVFQPVIDLRTDTTVGFEALTRFEDGSRPDIVFAAAREAGLGSALEIVTLEAALAEATSLPATAWLSLNVSPGLLGQQKALAALFGQTSRPLVLEVTEHEVIESYEPLRQAMLELGPTVRLAVDDAGSGVANFNHLVELGPDFVKIDASLVRGVDTDARRRAVVVGLIHYAAEAGCQVIAEGIETRAERKTVAELGVTLGQGFLLAKPARAGAWSARSEVEDTARRTHLPRLRGLPTRAAS